MTECSSPVHQPEDRPADCLLSSLTELAGSRLTSAERADTLAHGMRALAGLVKQRDDARGSASDLARFDPAGRYAGASSLTCVPARSARRHGSESR
jgi:hypothetical protein